MGSWMRSTIGTLIIVLLAIPARADPPRRLEVPTCIDYEGQPGMCLNRERWNRMLVIVESEKECRGNLDQCRREAAEPREEFVGLSMGVVVVIGVAALLVGVGAGVAIGREL